MVSTEIPIQVIDKSGAGRGTSRRKKKSSITVIENPSLDGLTGFLLSDNSYKLGGKIVLTNVLHIRADGRNQIVGYAPYQMVKEEEKTSPVSHYLIIADNGYIFPVGSILPHEICPIDSTEYEHFLRHFQESTEIKTIERVVLGMYQLLAQKVSAFSFEDGKLVLPENYASYKV